MKVETAVLLGASAINVGHAIAQECPAGSSPSISYVTVTYTPEPEPTPSPTDACPAGYSPVVSYITVTNTEDPVTTIASTSSEVPSTTIAPTTSDEPTTTITSTGTKTATITVTAGASASPVNAVEAKVQVQSSSYSSTAVAAASPKATTPAGSSSTTLGSSVSGQATFYGGNVSGGTCSFTDYTLPSGVFGTALSGANWDTSGKCGACVSVTGPSGKSITAMVVDKCPECASNHLDLFQDAFTSLADPSAGVIDITWEYVSCPISSPLKLNNKEGVSAYWFSMQVANSVEPVDSLEVSTDGGSTWQATERTDYNFFQNASGFGTTSVDVKITSSTGKTITVDGVQVADGSSTTASSNF